MNFYVHGYVRMHIVYIPANILLKLLLKAAFIYSKFSHPFIIFFQRTRNEYGVLKEK
jgi:hypothetical protein